MRFSIGVDDFKELRTDRSSKGELAFYCDKSLLIKDIIDDGAKVILIPRPRRFGKTLNLSMLKYFFGTKETELFAGLEILDHANIMENWHGKYPTVFISFKHMKCAHYDEFKTALKKRISDQYKNFEELQFSDKLGKYDRQKIERYYQDNFSDYDITNALLYLTEALSKHHNQPVVLLMDEYDMPLQDAYLKGYFQEAIGPFRNMFEAVFKGNTYLYKGVITGITRIAKENLFSGANNVQTYDITKNRYAQYFGFLEQEIKPIVPKESMEKLKSWYNGYTFGDSTIVYNPWSILQFCASDYKCEAYWINTSGNDLIKHTLTADKLEDAKILIEGGSIDIEIESFTVLDNLKENSTSFWNLLFIAGYLTLDANKKLRIPNKEILYFFEKVVIRWFGGSQENRFLKDFLNYLISGLAEGVQEYLQKFIYESLSFHDVTVKNQENFYHGLLLGTMLGLKRRYIVKSNRESGFGRYDIALYPIDPDKDPGIIIEVKIGKNIVSGLEQIQEKEYYTDLTTHRCSKILTYGFSFDGKTVSVVLG